MAFDYQSVSLRRVYIVLIYFSRHVDRDLKPYVCLAETCSETDRAYSTFEGWSEHMRRHNRHWYRRVYPTSSWVCAVCDSNHDIYSSPQDLHKHLENCHTSEFTSAQIQAISRQSKVERLRDWNDCLLCCFSVKEQDDNGPGISSKRKRGTPRQETSNTSRKVHQRASPDTHTSDYQYSNTSSDSDIDDSDSSTEEKQTSDRSKVMVRHIRVHLQLLMFLTLRFAALQNSEGQCDDEIKSNSVDFDEGSAVSVGNVFRPLSVTSEVDVPTKDISDTESPAEVIDPEYSAIGDETPVPDAEIDLDDVPRPYDDLKIEDDEFLKDLIERRAHRLSIEEKAVAPINDELLQMLRPADSHLVKEFIENQRGGLLEGSCRWILSRNDFERWLDPGETKGRLLCIEGPPGTGKTMLVCFIINELKRRLPKHPFNLVYFFCQAGDPQLHTADAVLRTLIYGLLEQQPSLQQQVYDWNDIRRNQLQHTLDLNSLGSLLVELLEDTRLRDTFIIVDALNECSEAPTMLSELRRASSNHTKVLVSARDNLSIDHRSERYISLEPNTTGLDLYIDTQVEKLSQAKEYSPDLYQSVRNGLRTPTATFLWVALVCQHLQRLPTHGTRAFLETCPRLLSELYRYMEDMLLASAEGGIYRQVLPLIQIAYRPIRLRELASYVILPEDHPNRIGLLMYFIEKCGTFLSLRGDRILVAHHTVSEFLQRGPSEQLFPASIETEQYLIFSRLLRTLSTGLRQNIYKLPLLRSNKVGMSKPVVDPLDPIEYASVYWAHHLKHSSAQDMSRADEEIGVFLQEHLLHWVEALSLLNSIPMGIESLFKLISLLHRRQRLDSSVHVGTLQETELVSLVDDAWKLLRYHEEGLEEDPLQIYSSALVFSPTASIVRSIFKHKEPEWIRVKPVMSSRWDLGLTRLEIPESYGEIKSVAFSPDGRKVASVSSGDLTITTWDSITGVREAVLGGHYRAVTTLGFSINEVLVSASEDGSLRLWNTAMGKGIGHLGHRSGVITTAVFSSDGTRMVSGSNDKTIRVWDTSGPRLNTPEGLKGMVKCPAFSLDNLQRMDRTVRSVRPLDTVSGRCLRTMRGHNSTVTSIALSLDAQKIVSASDDGIVKLWNTTSGFCLCTIHGHGRKVTCVAFSTDAQRIASASEDMTVRLWDTASGTCLHILMGHNDTVTYVAFSPTEERIVSASDDMTVKLWDAVTGRCYQTLEGHETPILSAVFSLNGERIISISDDGMIRRWDIHDDKVLDNHKTRVVRLAFSHDGRLVVSESNDGMVKLWDTETGRCDRTFDSHNGAAKFSSDSMQLYTAQGAVQLYSSVAMGSSSVPTVTLASPSAALSDYSVGEGWIMKNSKRLLWIPPEYRPYLWATMGSKVALVCETGRVLIIGFSDEHLLSHSME